MGVIDGGGKDGMVHITKENFGPQSWREVPIFWWEGLKVDLEILWIRLKKRVLK